MTTNNFQIEKNIPAPTRSRATGLSHALRQMAPGDSMLVDVGTHFRSSLAYAQKKMPACTKFVTRKVGDSRRVWRIA